MFTHRLNIFARALTLLGMPVIFDCLLLSQSAVGATLTFKSDVIVNGETIGIIDIKEAAGIGGKGLEGSFTPTGRTIPHLMTYLAKWEPDNTPPNHLNWLQVVTKSIYPASASGRPQANFIDPIAGGFSKQLSDNEPWYYDEYVPAPLQGKDPYDTSYLVANRTTSSALLFEDIVRQPPGTQLTFNTFLIADYGDKTYRPLGEGFQWSIESTPHSMNANLGVVTLKPPASVKYEPSLFDQLVSAFGYTRRPTPLISKTFSGTLASGSQIDNYKLDQLTPGSKYTAWTNNDLPSNRCNPNTYLSTYSIGSGSYLGDDNSSPVGNGFASGLTGTVGTSGTLNLAVRAANGGARGEDKGNYELFVNVYEDGESPTFSNGNSGGGGFGKGNSAGGGFGKEMRGLTQQNPILPTSVQNGWQTFSKG